MAADKTTGETKETRNAARRRRNKKMAALERERTSGPTKPSDAQHGDSLPPVTPEEEDSDNPSTAESADTSGSTPKRAEPAEPGVPLPTAAASPEVEQSPIEEMPRW